MDLRPKDVGLAQHSVTEPGLDLPLAAATAQVWKASAETLADGEDFCAIARRTSEDLFGKGE